MRQLVVQDKILLEYRSPRLENKMYSSDWNFLAVFGPDIV